MYDVAFRLFEDLCRSVGGATLFSICKSQNCYIKFVDFLRS